ncbi:hypothetical protein VPHF99_0209 [Vibrio phage F99]
MSKSSVSFCSEGFSSSPRTKNSPPSLLSRN